VGGRLEFITDVEEIYRRTVEHIDRKRADLGLPEYDASKWGQSGDARMNQLLDLPVEERVEAIYGGNGNGHERVEAAEDTLEPVA
jgi:hypothetical protein